MSAIQAGDVPTLNQNTTGSAGSVANAVTFNSSGGAAAGTTFNGSAARTVDYSTVGAPSTSGTGASGTWGISISGNAATVTNGVYTTNFTGSNQSLGSNGYQKLPGGLILQWGSVTVDPGYNGTASITFPTAFSSSVYSVTATPQALTTAAGNKRDSFSVQSVSTTGFEIKSAFEDIATVTYYWFAVGV
jgi:hypothetical protein